MLVMRNIMSGSLVTCLCVAKFTMANNIPFCMLCWIISKNIIQEILSVLQHSARKSVLLVIPPSIMQTVLLVSTYSVVWQRAAALISLLQNMHCICLRQFLGPFQTIVHICFQPAQIQMLMHNLQQHTIAVNKGAQEPLLIHLKPSLDMNLLITGSLCVIAYLLWSENTDKKTTRRNHSRLRATPARQTCIHGAVCGPCAHSCCWACH